MFGVLYHSQHDEWLEYAASDVDCVEIQVEQFYKSTPHRLRWLSARYPIIARCASFSLGGPDPIDAGQLASCAAILDEAHALWLAHPLGFNRAGEIDLGLMAPIPLTSRNLELVSDRIRQVSEHIGRPVLIENNASPLRIGGPLTETEFLNRLCARSGCKLAIDLRALGLESHRHLFNADAWVAEIAPEHVQQLRVTALPTAGLEEQLCSLRRLGRGAGPRTIVLASAPFGRLEDFRSAWEQVTTAVTSA